MNGAARMPRCRRGRTSAGTVTGACTCWRVPAATPTSTAGPTGVFRSGVTRSDSSHRAKIPSSSPTTSRMIRAFTIMPGLASWDWSRSRDTGCERRREKPWAFWPCSLNIRSWPMKMPSWTDSGVRWLWWSSKPPPRRPCARARSASVSIVTPRHGRHLACVDAEERLLEVNEAYRRDRLQRGRTGLHADSDLKEPRSR